MGTRCPRSKVAAFCKRERCSSWLISPGASTAAISVRSIPRRWWDAPFSSGPTDLPSDTLLAALVRRAFPASDSSYVSDKDKRSPAMTHKDESSQSADEIARNGDDRRQPENDQVADARRRLGDDVLPVTAVAERLADGERAAHALLEPAAPSRPLLPHALAAEAPFGVWHSRRLPNVKTLPSCLAPCARAAKSLGRCRCIS